MRPVVLPHARNSAVVKITFSSAVYCFHINLFVLIANSPVILYIKPMNTWLFLYYLVDHYNNLTSLSF